jgi:hypothetical protein
VERQQVSQLTTGVALVTAGLILTAHQLEWGPLWYVQRLWPIVFVIVAAPRLLFGNKDGQRGGGVWLLFLGLIFFLHTYRVLPLRHSWPLFIVAFGAALLIDSVVKPAAKRGA